jgi:Spy/CpxP family protein refolding chaperone
MTMTRKTAIVATMLLGAWGTTGCRGSSAQSAPPATAERSGSDDAAAGLMEHHRHHHHGGVTLFIAMSLDTLGVSPDQRATVEAIRSDLHARMEQARAAEQDLVTTLADGLAAGSIDTAKVDVALARLTAAAGALPDASADALNRLHDALTPPQRNALVDKVRAHWAVWQKENAAELGPSRLEGRLATLQEDLELTTAQVDRIRGVLAEETRSVPKLDEAAIAAHLRSFGDAFRSDKFDARTLTTATSANVQLVGWGGGHVARFVEAVSPVLTQDQRTTLAQELREHASHNPSAQANP